MDTISGTVVPFSYDGNEYEISIPQGDYTCRITTSSSMQSEKKKADSITGEEWLFEIENVYTLNLKITIPKDNDDIVLWINTTDVYTGGEDYLKVPHIYGENSDEEKDDCAFIKLSDLVTE